MNIKNKHFKDKAISAINLFKATEGSVLALQILKDEFLKEHITKVPALLLCVDGTVIYEDEQGKKLDLSNGDFIEITPNVKHWLEAKTESQLLLFK